MRTSLLYYPGRRLGPDSRQYEQKERQRFLALQEKEDPYVRLARYTIETFVETGRLPEIPRELPEELYQSRAGAFVSLKEDGKLSPEVPDTKRYGVIVTKGARRGLLLPNLEGVDTVEQQIAIAKQKAGIKAHESVELEGSG